MRERDMRDTLHRIPPHLRCHVAQQDYGAYDEVDQAVSKLLREAEKRAETIITEHRDGLDRLVAGLEAEETLSHDAIEACLSPPAGDRKTGTGTG